MNPSHCSPNPAHTNASMSLGGLLAAAALLASPSAQSETFIVPVNAQSYWVDASNASALCWAPGSDRTDFAHCTPESTVDDLAYPLVLEVSCDSDYIRVTMPSKRRVNPAGIVEFDHDGERVRVDVRTAKRIRSRGYSMLDARLLSPMDIWFGAGGRPVLKSALTSGPVRWPGLGDLFTFEVSREQLWAQLRSRQKTSDRFDNPTASSLATDTLMPEKTWMDVIVWPVKDVTSPKEYLIKMQGRIVAFSGDYSYLRHYNDSFMAPKWRLYGTSTWRDIEVYHHHYFGHETPKEIFPDLNRLQDYYNSCSSTAPQISEAPDTPVRQNTRIDPEAEKAQAAILELRKTYVWHTYKDLTLEDFAVLK